MYAIMTPPEGRTAILDLAGQPMSEDVYEVIYAFLGQRYTLGKITTPEKTTFFDVTRVKPSGFGVVGAGPIPEWGITWHGLAQYPHSLVNVINIGL